VTQLINQRIGERESVGGEDLELIKGHLQRITRQVMICTSISRRYLDAIRQSPNDAVHISVGEILRDVNDLLRFHPSLKNHDLTVKPLTNDLVAAIGGTDLIQILMNLSINALQATTEKHAVEISAEAVKQELNIEKLADGPTDRYVNRDVFKNTLPMVTITIRDTGPGIAPPTLAKLFQVYFTTKPRGQGTGLGLCIVQRLLGEAHALLHLHSVVGEGTSFTLYIPGRVH
jgi:signal transduction histidine kinase